MADLIFTSVETLNRQRRRLCVTCRILQRNFKGPTLLIPRRARDFALLDVDVDLVINEPQSFPQAIFRLRRNLFARSFHAASVSDDPERLVVYNIALRRLHESP